jgi:hypothetical protein
MKNERTPRTLAETTFQTGYQSARPTTHVAEWVILAIFVGWIAYLIFGG